MINRVIDLNLAGTQITDELHSNVGSSLLVLGHSTFFGGADLAIRTAANGGGTMLVENTDYICQNEDADLTTQAGKPVYTGLTITNATYQSGNLYISYKSVGDYVNASLLNELFSNMYHRNRLINGNFDPVVGWQRGTSFTLNSAEVKFTADRWRCTQGTGGAGTVSYQAVTPGDVPGAISSLRWQQTTAATTAPEIMQPIESVPTFAGDVCTLSFWVKATAAITIQLALRQNFGTGGTPSASVDIASQSFTVGTSWQRITATFTVPSIAGKTLGTDGNNYLGVRIILPVGATFDIQFTLVQLESGNMATEFEWRPRGQELADQQRYFEKNYNNNITPGSISSVGFYGARCTSPQPTLTACMFKVSKRSIPTILLYSPDTGVINKLRNKSVGTDVDGMASFIGINAFTIEFVNPLSEYVGYWFTWFYTADAEFYN